MCIISNVFLNLFSFISIDIGTNINTLTCKWQGLFTYKLFFSIVDLDQIVSKGYALTSFTHPNGPPSVGRPKGKPASCNIAAVSETGRLRPVTRTFPQAYVEVDKRDQLGVFY